MSDELERLARRHVGAHASARPAESGDAARWLAILGPAWRIDDGWLSREQRTEDFAAALDLAVLAGRLAEAMDHHPRLSVAYERFGLRIRTESLSALSEVDFVWAARFERSLAESKPRAG